MDELKKFWPFKDSFYKTKIYISEDEKKQIKLFLNNFKNSIDVNQTTTFEKINILNLPTLKDLKKQITDILDSLDLLLDVNWAQQYKKGSEHPLHSHHGSVYSGVLYVDQSKETQGTAFLHPAGDVVKISTNRFKYLFKSNFEPSVLILFPSHVTHFVKPEKEDNGRIVISFNTRESEKSIYNKKGGEKHG
tara:strand:+ start:213 stop:785 length:573 start_codon:yes stop_codon:yes gene_type:complete